MPIGRTLSVSKACLASFQAASAPAERLFGLLGHGPTQNWVAIVIITWEQRDLAHSLAISLPKLLKQELDKLQCSTLGLFNADKLVSFLIALIDAFLKL